MEPAEGVGSRRVVASRADGDAEPAALEVEPVAVHGSLGLQPGGWPRSLAGLTLSFEAVEHEAPSVRRVPVADGSWEGLLAPGEWRAAGRLDGHPLALAPDVVRVPPGGGAVPRMEVLAAPAVRGRLVDCAGVPVPGVVVGLKHERGGERASDVTPSDGTFVLKALAGRSWTVLVDEVSLPDSVGTPWWQGIGDGGVVGSEHQLQSAVGGEVVDVVLFAPGRVSGRAVGARGEALGGVTLSIRMKPDLEQPARGANYVVRTDAAGAFETRLPAGRYEARLFPAPGGAGQAWLDPIVFETDCYAHESPLTIVFDQGLGAHTLTVAVVDVNGQPQAGIPLVLYAREPGLRFENRDRFHAKGWGRSNARGRLSIGVLPAGRYLLCRALGPTVNSDLVFADLQDRLLIDLDGSDREVAWKVEPFVPGRLELVVSPEAFSSWPVKARLEIGDRLVEPGRLLWGAGVHAFERVLPGIGELAIVGVEARGEAPLASRPVTILPGETTKIELL